MKRLVLLLLAIVAINSPCLGFSPSDDIADKFAREPLHNITHVTILVGNVDSDIKHDGLDIEAIKISLENKLRIAGLKIEPMSSMWLPYETRPQLIFLDVEALKINDEPRYCYEVRFEVTNWAVLVQNKKVSGGYTVWEKHELGYAGTNKLSAIKDICDTFADKFVNDWLKAKDEVPGAYLKNAK